MHFIATKKLSIESGKTFNTLFEKRHSGDYDDFVICDQTMVNDLLPKTVSFIREVESILY